jgi:hypothetical protein
MSYSPELVARYIKYFKEVHKVTFTTEQAEEGLGNLAGLYEVFAHTLKKPEL